MIGVLRFSKDHESHETLTLASFSVEEQMKEEIYWRGKNQAIRTCVWQRDSTAWDTGRILRNAAQPRSRKLFRSIMQLGQEAYCIASTTPCGSDVGGRHNLSRRSLQQVRGLDVAQSLGIVGLPQFEAFVGSLTMTLIRRELKTRS